jgi:hypothetical protein
MTWSIAQVISDFRKHTGKPDTSHISDENILIELNHFYQYIFVNEPRLQGAPELDKTWYTFNSSDGVGSQALPATISVVKPPVYVDDLPATLWIDEERFYTEYPHDYTSEAKPSDILLWGRTLILRPIPDDTYEVRLAAVAAPSELTDAFTLSNSAWGPAIAAGASVHHLKLQGDDDQAKEVSALYDAYLSNISRQIIQQWPPGRRPRGRRF